MIQKSQVPFIIFRTYKSTGCKWDCPILMQNIRFRGGKIKMAPTYASPPPAGIMKGTMKLL